MTEEVKKGKQWTPNAKQIQMAELLINPEDRRTKKEKCADVGLTPKTLCSWLKDDRFVEYLRDRIELYTNAELPEIWRSLIAQCKRGNVAAMKLFFMLKNLYPNHQAW